MSDAFMRHLISLIGALVCLVVYWAGFMAGKTGWWWTMFGVVVIYVIIYKLIEV